MHFRTGFVGVCATTAAACTLAVTPALASASPPTVKLRNSVSRAATRAPRTGAVAGDSQIAFQVNLKLPDQQAAEKFATSVSTPGSASYGKYLTAAQWESRFSPSASSVEAVERFLRQSGFKVAAASADRMEVSASGTATQVEHAFSTSLAMYRVQGRTLRLANQAFAVPGSLGSIVQGVSGVNQTLSHPNSTTGASAATGTPRASGKNIPQPAGFRVAPPCGAFYNQQIALGTAAVRLRATRPTRLGNMRLHAIAVPRRLWPHRRETARARRSRSSTPTIRRCSRTPTRSRRSMTRAIRSTRRQFSELPATASTRSTRTMPVTGSASNARRRSRPRHRARREHPVRGREELRQRAGQHVANARRRASRRRDHQLLRDGRRRLPRE